MSLRWKIVIALLLCALLWLTFRDFAFKSEIAGVVSSVDYAATSNVVRVVSFVTNVVVVTNVVQVDDSSSSFRSAVIRGDFVYHSSPPFSWVTFAGCDFRVGYPSEFGRVILLDKFMVACVDDNGKSTYLMPSIKTDYEQSRSLPSPRFTSSGDGMERAGRSRYYVHTGTAGASMK